MVEPIYQPREPKASPLYRSIRNHFAEFESVYEERYQKRFGVLRDVVRDVIYKYLGCGDLKNGFARIKCKECQHEVLFGLLVQGTILLPFLPPEKGPDVRGMDHRGDPLSLTP